MGPLESSIRQKLERAFQPEYYELENESHMHSVPRNSETHFRALVVAEAFQGKSRVERSRMITDLLKDEFANKGLHALAQRTFTPQEWEPIKGTFEMASPECRGGSKRELK